VTTEQLKAVHELLEEIYTPMLKEYIDHAVERQARIFQERMWKEFCAVQHGATIDALTRALGALAANVPSKEGA
jgi:hypothetical protein